MVGEGLRHARGGRRRVGEDGGRGEAGPGAADELQRLSQGPGGQVSAGAGLPMAGRGG